MCPTHVQKQAVFEAGRFSARLASCEEDLRQARRLRYRAFIDRSGAGTQGEDGDAFDESFDHLMIEEAGVLVATARFKIFACGKDLAQGYSAQYYDLSPFLSMNEPILELGRFCVSPQMLDPDVLRLAWGVLAYLADAAQAAHLVGCSSFLRADPKSHQEALTLLRQSHLAPEAFRVGRKAKVIYSYAEHLAGRPVERIQALRQMPPLLRSYLQMGGWVSDHAVLDHSLDTLHVFTCVTRAQVPQARLQALRQIVLLQPDLAREGA